MLNTMRVCADIGWLRMFCIVSTETFGFSMSFGVPRTAQQLSSPQETLLFGVRCNVQS